MPLPHSRHLYPSLPVTNGPVRGTVNFSVSFAVFERGPDQSGRLVNMPGYVSSPKWRALVCALALPALLGGCFGASDAPLSTSAGTMAAQAAGARVAPVFIASTRRESKGTLSESAIDGGAHYAISMVSVPPTHKAGEIEEPSFGKANPEKHFAVLGGHDLDPEDFRLQIATYLSGRIGSNRDILLYVHGFNTSEDEARFRLAQLVHDGGFGGVAVLFTWPSKSDLFSYVSDKESATASRDALQKLMRDLAQVEGVGRVHVLAHSMGSWLAMEALRENAIAGSRNLGNRLGDVMLASPDIDLSVFKTQMSRLPGANVSVFVSANDRALNLSSKLAGARPRVGAMDARNPKQREELAQLGVKVYDLTGSSAGFIGHSLYGDVPAVVRTIGAQLGMAREDSGVTAMIDATSRMPTEVNVPPAQTPTLVPMN